MYSRNKLRKEQQLLNLRQLTAKTSSQHNTQHNPTEDYDHNSSRTPPQSMANRSNSSPPNQSLKASNASRSQCRTPKRDNSSPNDCQQSTSSKSETNSMLRSVNKSPTLRSQTLRTDSRGVGLQSRPTLSPNSRREASLPQSLTQSPKSLSQINKNNEKTKEVKQRSVKSVTESQSQQKSMSSTSTSTTTTTETTISPEIVFLVRQQAKAIAQINALNKKVQLLEHTIKGQKNTHVFDQNPTLQMTGASGCSPKRLNSNSNNSKERIAISDDSGGEYSRATTTSDDDELSLLLDQIARRSQQLSNSHIINNRFTNASISNSISGNNNKTTEVLPQTMQFRSKRHTSSSYTTSPAPTPHSNQSPIREPVVERKLFSNINNFSALMASQSLAPVIQPSAPPPSVPQSPYNQSISALLFEPNVENVLKNLDEIIATEAIDSNKFSNASTLSQTYQRSQTSQHSSQSLYDNIGLNAVGVTSSESLLIGNNTCSSPASKWQLERAHTLVKQREERELDKQNKLNEEWLQNQLKADPKLLRCTKYIDSLEPTFR